MFGELNGSKLNGLAIVQDERTPIIETRTRDLVEFNQETGEETVVGTEDYEVTTGYNEVYPKYKCVNGVYEYIAEAPVIEEIDE